MLCMYLAHHQPENGEGYGQLLYQTAVLVNICNTSAKRAALSHTFQPQHKHADVASRR